MRFPGELRQTNNETNPWFNWRTNLLFPQFHHGGARNWAHDHDGIPAGYYKEGFLFLQQFIFQAFMSIKNEGNIDSDEIPDIIMNVRKSCKIHFHVKNFSIFQKFPYPPFVLDTLLPLLRSLVSFFVLLGFIYPCVNIIKSITMEKEKQLKEAMKIMGLGELATNCQSGF